MSETAPQIPRETLNAIDCSRSPHASAKAEATRCGEGSKAAGQETPFCPRCFDALLPAIGGLPGKVVDGVMFCIFCAWHVESDPAEREKWVRWARTEAAN